MRDMLSDGCGNKGRKDTLNQSGLVYIRDLRSPEIFVGLRTVLVSEHSFAYRE